LACDVEAPSGKTAADENFPVGSRLLAADKRPIVAAYYAFARAADDIADDASLEPQEKIARLNAMGAALEEGRCDRRVFAKAHRLRDAFVETGIPFAHATDLLIAFKRDAETTRTADWAALTDYCRYSAAPVGRFLLDLHGEDRALFPAADALCAALQVLNHLQDCGKDLRGLNRVYLPDDWMAVEGTGVEDLRLPASTPGMRRVIDRCLDGVDALMRLARTFPPKLRSRRLAMESAVIVDLADRLTARLRRGDPLATRVALTKSDFARATVAGVLSGLVPPRRPTLSEGADAVRDPDEHVAGIVARSGSSFTSGMRILSRDRRRAMYAIYAFCREVDDDADEPNPIEVKLALLEGRRREIAAVFAKCPTTPTGRALARAVRLFHPDRDEFLAVIDGMEMDLRAPLHAPDMETLRLYCRRVAGAVGLLSLAPFGATDAAAREFAIALGEALQLTNILRDVEEDANLGRLYLPREALTAAGLPPDTDPTALVRMPGFDAACREVAKVARARFAEADRALVRSDRQALRPALVMMGVYEEILTRLERRGWAGDLSRVRIGKFDKLRAAWSRGIHRPVASEG